MVKEGERAQNKIKKLKNYKMVQLPLFIMPEQDRDYSNTIELYDAIPKYFWGKTKRIEGQFLEPLERKFQFRDTGYKVAITPARIKDKDGNYRDYYPGQREELIEDALRKLACDGAGCLLDDQASVIFSLHQLRQELKRMGHTFSLREIKDALFVCTRANMVLENEDGTAIVDSSLFETEGLQTQEDWKGTGKKTKCFVRFNPLVTRSIKTKTFRQLNYKECMSYKRVLARWLHKRMSHVYKQASWNNSYSILLTTIIRDSGMKPYKRVRDNLRKVREALDEMKGKGVVAAYAENKIVEHGKRKIVDVKFSITPGMSFITDMKKANRRSREITSEGQNGRFESRKTVGLSRGRLQKR